MIVSSAGPQISDSLDIQYVRQVGWLGLFDQYTTVGMEGSRCLVSVCVCVSVSSA
jgi:hypothetical protein